MKGYSNWSYAPYKPPMFDTGDIYICRIAPDKNSIHFEWLDIGEKEYSIYYKKREDAEFTFYKEVSTCECDITELDTDTDYEFYVTAGVKKSRIRLARCAPVIGTVVNYLHPDDEAYSFSGRYLCSPSFVCHPDGYILASMDVFNHRDAQNLTLIFRSDDNGESWHYASELMPCFWGKLFLHKDEIYMLSCSTEFGDLLIGKTTDGGKTFPAPTVLMRGSNGKKGKSGWHKNPQNILLHNGRIYEALEWAYWDDEQRKQGPTAALVMSCDEDDDLLVPENWSFTEPRLFNPNDAPELKDIPWDVQAIEGTLTIAPDGKLLDIMRFGYDGYALCYEIDTANPEAPLKYSRLMEFNAHRAKFMIQYDEVSKKYFTIANYIYNPETKFARNLSCLMRSDDLKKWEVVCNLHDYRHVDWHFAGIQYVAFEFQGDDIIYLARTALNNPHNHHDSNYSTFHRIKNFRELL
ncbi:MAG: hypothetical protein E7406_06600 [Ruminococcaceae bacterium]|nr:hypothetical protein [Oscillospiraceae bacterium]